MIKITEIVAGQHVYFVLHRPAFIQPDGTYRPSRLPHQSHGYHSVVRAFGRVMAHNTAEHLLVVQPALKADLGSNRPEGLVEIPWWSIRKLMRWTGEYSQPAQGRDRISSTTTLNRSRAASMWEWEKYPMENPQAMPPSMLFEEVRINVTT